MSRTRLRLTGVGFFCTFNGYFTFFERKATDICDIRTYEIAVSGDKVYICFH